MRGFVSYSHIDEAYRVELEKHMALLRRQGLIDLWSDHCIRPGEELDPGIKAALEVSEIILLLISADFINSEYCYSKEMLRAVERHREGSAIVIPIIVRPYDWHTAPFGNLKALPTDGKPVTRWPNLDEAFLDITQQLRKMLTARLDAAAHRTETGHPPAFPSSSIQSPTQNSVRVSRSSNLALPREFSDEDKHDFLVSSFTYLQDYFQKSLQELQARHSGVTYRLTPLSPESFKAIVFQNGKRAAGCFIRISAHFGAGIAYSGNEAASDNSHNEMLTVQADKHLLYLTAGMAMFGNRDREGRLTEEGAAEHLWSMFFSQMQR